MHPSILALAGNPVNQRSRRLPSFVGTVQGMTSRVKRAAVAGLAALLAGCGSPAPTPTSPARTEPAATTAAAPVPTPTLTVDSFAPAGWVDLASVDPAILVEIRYATAHNFVGRPVAGYLEPRCLLPQATARALASARQAASADGYTLKVYDCYRPARATADFVLWRDTADTATQAEFYPGLTKQQVFDRGFVAGTHSNHSSGGAVDVTLVRLPAADQPTYRPGEALEACTAPVGRRWPDSSIDMGTGYDCFDARARTLDGAVSGAARENRLLLRRLMTGAGFTNYPGEWWHYDLARAPNPGQWFDFPVASAAVR